MANDRLPFLNLEVQKESIRGTIDHIEIACFHKENEKFKHYFHLEKGSQSNLNNISYQQNCIADLCYLNTRNFQAFSESYDIRTRASLNLFTKTKERLNSIEEQLKVLITLISKIIRKSF